MLNDITGVLRFKHILKHNNHIDFFLIKLSNTVSINGEISLSQTCCSMSVHDMQCI